MSANACLMPDKHDIQTAPDRERSLAITAELLFLTNLTILPVVSLLVLVILWCKRDAKQWLACNHIEQALFTSLWAALLMLAMVATVLLTGENPLLSWSILIPVLALLHGGLILLGAVGLTRAMEGRSWRYPVLGPDIDQQAEDGPGQRRQAWKR